jgi:hypothetical protein
MVKCGCYRYHHVSFYCSCPNDFGNAAATEIDRDAQKSADPPSATLPLQATIKRCNVFFFNKENGQERKMQNHCLESKEVKKSRLAKLPNLSYHPKEKFLALTAQQRTNSR